MVKYFKHEYKKLVKESLAVWEGSNKAKPFVFNDE